MILCVNLRKKHRLLRDEGGEEGEGAERERGRGKGEREGRKGEGNRESTRVAPVQEQRE